MNKLDRYLRSTFVLCILGLLTGVGLPAPAATYQVLHSFGVLTNLSGYSPEAPLIQGPDGTLYGTGTTSEGSFRGTVFKIQPDGSGFTVLKRFGNYSDGQTPRGPLALVGNTLYGTVQTGGFNGAGSVYAIHTDGTGFTNLYNFPYNSPTDGQYPYSGVAASGNVLYGATYRGGNGSGTIFRMNTDGTAYTNLYQFTALTANTNSDGNSLYGALVLAGNTLYGTAYYGGLNGSGTVFAMNTDGSGFAVLHQFGALNSNTNTDGANPFGGLAVSGGRLYGTTYYGGRRGRGVVFAVNANGTGFTNLLDLDYPIGAYSYATPVVSGNRLYVTAIYGGGKNYGRLFALNTDGTGYASLFDFVSTNGYNPYCGVILSNNTLFGTTYQGGNRGVGTIYRVSTNGTAFTNLYDFHYSSPGSPYGSVLVAGGMVYGTADLGGVNGAGTLFRMNPDGSGYADLHDFGADNGATNDGVNPQSELTLFNGELYGTTESGGNSGTGTIFKISTNGTGYTVVYHLTYYGGSYPVSGVMADGGVLYGVARYGGAFGYGAVYRVNPDGTAYTNLHDFTALANNTNGDGVYPYGRPVVTNGWIYGAALDGGPAGSGTVFALTTTGTGFTNLHNFSALVSSTNADGAYPQGGLVLVGNRLYGTTTGGGTNGQGVVFALNTDGGSFVRLHDFAYGVGNGAYAYSGLLWAKGRLYGTTYYGGDNGYGTVFSIGVDGSNYGNLYSFGFATGAYPYCPVTISGNLLYGTAYGGGEVGAGAVFSLGLTAPILRIQRPGGVPVLSWDDPSFVLQSAPALGGTYTNVPGAASPYTNPVTGSRKFFRLMGN